MKANLGDRAVIHRSVFACCVILAVGCTTASLGDPSGDLTIRVQKRTTEAVLTVLPFSAEPAARLTEEDLQRWHAILIEGLQRSHLFESVRLATPTTPAPAGGYTLAGRIDRFQLQEQWVPLLFPIHLVMSLGSLTMYTLAGGPFAKTVARLDVHFELVEAGSGHTLGAFEEHYASDRYVNIHTELAENPYHNPSLALSDVINSAVSSIEAAL